MKIKDVMEIQRFFILSVISYKSYSDTSISWCWELGILEFQKFFWIPLTNTIILRYNMPISVADPGFSPGGAPTPKSAIIFQFFPENCTKMKEFGPPGGARIPGAPP